jgi:hypothetical protein
VVAPVVTKVTLLLLTAVVAVEQVRLLLVVRLQPIPADPEEDQMVQRLMLTLQVRLAVVAEQDLLLEQVVVMLAVMQNTAVAVEVRQHQLQMLQVQAEVQYLVPVVVAAVEAQTAVTQQVPPEPVARVELILIPQVAVVQLELLVQPVQPATVMVLTELLEIVLNLEPAVVAVVQTVVVVVLDVLVVMVANLVAAVAEAVLDRQVPATGALVVPAKYGLSAGSFQLRYNLDKCV